MPARSIYKNGAWSCLVAPRNRGVVSGSLEESAVEMEGALEMESAQLVMKQLVMGRGGSLASW